MHMSVLAMLCPVRLFLFCIFRLPYFEYAGGVISFTPGQFKAINGFSNVFFGWGGEDDNLRHRFV